VGAHPQNDAYSYALAITAVSPPTTRLIFENPSSFCCSAFAPVFASFPSSLFLLSYSKFTRVIRIGSKYTVKSISFLVGREHNRPTRILI
jgi:hypothetical protein